MTKSPRKAVSRRDNGALSTVRDKSESVGIVAVKNGRTKILGAMCKLLSNTGDSELVDLGTALREAFQERCTEAAHRRKLNARNKPGPVNKWARARRYGGLKNQRQEKTTVRNRSKTETVNYAQQRVSHESPDRRLLDAASRWQANETPRPPV
ncbi:hypothetical protein K438DRAFT_1771883 [Mycena galopus ATCC 62051]|nr:hypothetical protein K438DRAFT_1771883 [Mycena galopus ATCC 62051]